jgi:hypothetical protein
MAETSFALKIVSSRLISKYVPLEEIVYPP